MRALSSDYIGRLLSGNVVLVALVCAPLLHAQQDGAGPPLPVAASSVALNAEMYLGKYVSLVGSVERQLSSTAFVVEQGVAQTAGQGVLVLTPSLNAKLDPKMRLTVLGNVVTFDPDQIADTAKDHPLNLGSEPVEKYRGWPTVLAVSVIDADLNELVTANPSERTADAGRRSNR